MKAVAFLRAVNVGGTGKIAMADLRALAEELGLGEPRTLLQSGNLVFDAKGKTPKVLEALLEKELTARFDLKCRVMVRGARQMKALAARNPFPKEAKNDPARLHVFFLKDTADAAAVAALNAAIKGRETAKGHGREVFLHYPDGMGESKLTNAVVERALSSPGTARNWNTVTKILELT
ncbi:MAG: DUF1697 domain-containing protein [Rhizomicrobium sp.]